MTLRKEALENIVGKEENAGYQHFLLFSQNVFYYSQNKIQFFSRIYFVVSWGSRLLKTFWKKEKMLVTSIFSFSQNVFYHFQNKFQFFSGIYFVVCKFFQFGLV